MTATVNDDLLRSTVCPRCEYPLRGLPAATVCPECGRAYDGVTLYLFGGGAGPAIGVSRLLGRWAKQWPLQDGVRMKLGPEGVRVEHRGSGPYPFERPDRVAPLPWAWADAFDLQLSCGDSVRITCANGRDVWMPIDLTLWCPAQAVLKLRERIAQWRGLAERPI